MEEEWISAGNADLFEVNIFIIRISPEFDIYGAFIANKPTLNSSARYSSEPDGNHQQWLTALFELSVATGGISGAELGRKIGRQRKTIHHGVSKKYRMSYLNEQVIRYEHGKQDNLYYYFLSLLFIPTFSGT
ncbi:MAG: hypothetical protein PHU93_02470 [Candidatus Gracilibacteria bacterium]|nr:hypothetical protein [Candidatus Gracilibacteria bacterium]